jgi:hypothetical protein
MRRQTQCAADVVGECRLSRRSHAQAEEGTRCEQVSRRGNLGFPFDEKNSPSRLRFRPRHPLAFRLRVLPPGAASTYSRPVLGARGKLAAAGGAAQELRERRPRNLRKLLRA